MVNLSDYPYPSYVPSKAAAGCVFAVVCISLIAWIIQSYQIRFRPPRLIFLILISHLTICIELIVRAALTVDQQNSKTVFIVMNSIFALGQRMIIVGNFIFVLEIHHKKSLYSRIIFIGTIVCLLTSSILMAEANSYSLHVEQVNKSFTYRQISASILLVTTVIFFPVLIWSKTLNDMTMQAILLIFISSVLCLIAAIFNVFQSASEDNYNQINSHEGWFYGFQMVPIILAHFAWSVFHPKRSLTSAPLSALEMRNTLLTNEESSV